MRYFLKGFLYGILGISLISLIWLMIVRPQLTARDAAELKDEYSETVSGATSPGDSVGEESSVDIRNRQISRRIKKHLWLSNRSWARDVHSFGILHSWGALAGKSCSAQASSIWLIAGAFRRTQSK